MLKGPEMSPVQKFDVWLRRNLHAYDPGSHTRADFSWHQQDCLSR